MKYLAIPLLIAWIVVPCHGQEQPYYTHFANAPVVVDAGGPEVPASLVVPADREPVRLPYVDVADPPMPSAAQEPAADTESGDMLDQKAESKDHTAECGCNSCRARRGGGSPFGRVKAWWENEAHYWPPFG